MSKDKSTDTMRADVRPKRFGWAMGNYSCTCFACKEKFQGDKRASLCADCAYAIPEKTSDQLLIEAYEKEKIDQAVFLLTRLNRGQLQEIRRRNKPLADFLVGELTKAVL